MMNVVRFRGFIGDLTRLVGQERDAAWTSAGVRDLMAGMLAHDDWLPPAQAVARTDTYCQYLLHCDPLERFSVVSFVWDAGQITPIHDHTVWGVVGVLRGAEHVRSFVQGGDGGLIETDFKLTRPGDINVLLPPDSDIHQVSNALDDGVTISIHIYGANLGRLTRHAYDPQTGRRTPFVSTYTNDSVANVWHDL